VEEGGPEHPAIGRSFQGNGAALGELQLVQGQGEAKDQVDVPSVVGFVADHERIVVAEDVDPGHIEVEDFAEAAVERVVALAAAGGDRDERGDGGEGQPLHGFSMAICSTPLAPLR
jgi:hypothetical protein